MNRLPRHDPWRSSMYSLVRTSPLRTRVRPWAFNRSFDELNDLVDSFLTPGRVGGALSTPVVTSAWEDGALKLTVDLPGVPQDAVDVSVAGRTLSVAAKTDTLSWQRRLSLGASLDPEQVSANYADGRLTVIVGPVAEPQARRIEIETVVAPAIETGHQPEGEQDTSSTV